MAAPPYMKLYVGDYLGDTHHLGALEHGAYLLLLMAMWRAGGSLPANDGNLARLARCTPDQWAEIKDVVLPYFKRSRGRLTQSRLAREMSKYEDTSGKRSEAGKRGASEKARKNKGEPQANASRAESNSRHNQNQNQSSSEEGKPSSALGASLDPDATAWSSVKALLADRAGMSPDAAGRFFGSLLGKHKLQAREMFPAIASAATNGTGDPKGYLAAAANRLAAKRGGITAEERMIRSNIQ